MEKCLSVIPESHLTENENSYWTNFTQPLYDILCKPGDAVIFNANIIHVGTFNKKDDNLRIQLKVTHKEDIDKIAYYENFNKVLNTDNKWPLTVRQIQRSVSCTFPGLSDLTQGENIRSARGTDNGINVGIMQQIFSYIFYGNADYYDLPNAF
jgi:ectoine hydroxylase-related dioxygenase (phytanoyl-CoA dioxygenase family)